MTFNLDGFEIGERLGAGGFGEVWQALQLGVDRPVAIKIGNTPISDAADQLRFERECKALGRLSTHPNIVTVYTSARLADGRPVLVLEFVDGGTLQHWALNNSSTEPQLLNLGADLAAAVVEAHRHNILHRDLKPQNVLLRTTGEAILADFGIAQLQDGLRTVTGNVTASAAYAAPEVLDGERASERADLYGIGICLLAAATQSTPFTTSEDDTLYPVLTRVLTASPPDLTELGYSAELNSLVQRLLAKNPAERPDSALSVLAEFQGMNAGLHRHQRVTPRPITSSVVDDSAASRSADPPTEPPSDPSAPAASPSAGPGPVPAPGPGPGPGPAPQPLASPAPSPELVTPPRAVTPPPAAAAPPAAAPPAAAPAAAAWSTPTPAPATAPVSQVAAPVSQVAPPVSQVAAPQRNTSPKMIGAVVGAIVLAGIALFFLFGRSDPESTVASVASPTPAAAQNAAADQAQDQATEPVSQDEPTAVPQTSTAEPANTAPQAGEEPRRDPLPLTEPVLVSDSIDVALDFRDYPIDLVAGQEVSVEVESLNDSCERNTYFDLRIFLLDPSGEQVGEDGWPGNYGCSGFGGSDWMATQDGTYTVRFLGGRGGSTMQATGTYEATIATLRRQREPIDPSQLVTIEGTIDRALDSTSFEIDGRAGQVIGVGMQDINGECQRSSYFNLRFALFDPSGDQVGDEAWPGNYGCDASGRWPLELDGVHTLSFYSDDDTGTFTAIVGFTDSPVLTLDAAERVHPIQHTFVMPRDEVFYEIDLAQGQAISVEVTTINGSCSRADYINLYVQVVDPTGEPIGDEGWAGNYGCQGYGPWEAAVAGPHLVHFYEASGGTGEFEATIGRLGG